MRRLLLVVVLGLVAGAGLMALVEHDPGLVVVSYGSTTIETSVWLAAAIWLITWWLLVTGFRLMRGTWALRHAVSGWLGGRKARHAAVLTNRGLISYIEGNWARSRRQLLRAARYSQAPLLNYLMAARASFRLGDGDNMQRYLGEAEGVESDARIALELTQAELQLNAGQNEQALATLVRARDNASRHPYVLELLTTAYTRLEDWGALQSLMPDLRKVDVLGGERLQELELATWTGLLRASSSADQLKKIWLQVPRPLTQDARSLRQAYVSGLLTHQAWDSTEKFIVSELDRNWDRELAGFLGSFPASRPEKLLKVMKRWLEQRSGDAILLLAAARLALQTGDEGLALDYLEQSHAAEPDAVVCMELARLHEARGEIKRARQLVQQAAEQLVGPLPDWRQR